MSYSDNISFMLLHIAATISKQNDVLLQNKLRIGFSQFKILMVLQWKPNIKQKQIASKLNQTEASISRQINIMFEDGLLQTTRSSEDRRQHITMLTVRGERICNQATKLLKAHSEAIFNQLSNNEKESLQRNLKSINNFLLPELNGEITSNE